MFFVESLNCFPQGVSGTPLPVKDGDLLATIHSMLCLRGMDTVTVSKVMLLKPWLKMVMFD